MSNKFIGQSVLRTEDKRFTTGKGRYTDDIKLVGMTYAYILRSPYAHARIKRIDISAAKAMPGVLPFLLVKTWLVLAFPAVGR